MDLMNTITHENFDPHTINSLLEQVDDYIITLAHKHLPWQMSSLPTHELNVNELAQITRIKLWQALQRHYVSDIKLSTIKAYTRTIVRNEAVNMLRAHKQTFPLPINEEGELYSGQMLMATTCESMQDPSSILEQQEQLTECAYTLANAIEALPARQRTAMLCEVKDHIEDTLPVLTHFRNAKNDIHTVKWPRERKEVHTFKSSLCISRKKLRYQLSTTL
jgi:RNA polymerase sigma factor (sigma-70 family)